MACVTCRYFIADKQLCAAPQLVDLARLVLDEPLPGASIGAFDARLNQTLCGTPGYWFAPDVPKTPATKPLPASAGVSKRKKRL